MSQSKNSGVRLSWRRIITLAILTIALFVSLGVGSVTGSGSESRWTPNFALDLEGGTELILTPKTTDNSEITSEDVNQAIEIIRQRVDASGVAEAEITSQGGSNIVVGLPGHPSQETLDLVRNSAVLRMRPVLAMANPGTMKGEGENAAPLTGAALEEAAMKAADADGDGKLSTTPPSEPTSASDPAWAKTERVTYDALTLDCTAENPATAPEDNPDTALVACGQSEDSKTGEVTPFKYVLGPAEIAGTNLTRATSGFDQQQGQWIVQLEFDNEGAQKFSEVTGRLVGLQSPQNQFAIVLDGRVISSAVPQTQISGGQASINGSGINATTSRVLANQLQFGSLPLEFEVQSEQQISATLGSESLRAGLVAGLIGLVLIVLYLVWQYHALAIVAVGSVVLATGLSYGVICLLSWVMGYRLSMAGVVGLVISIGITVDSFIVFFERIRDEIRDGHAVRTAVQRGWKRATRTIIASDSVNLIAAGVLYFIAVGSVRGFAFTLGLTTILDLVVVFMFTYPLMTLLVRTKFFGGGHPASGMSAKHLAHTPAYRGRKLPGEGSLAERRTRERRAALPASSEGKENA
ncbi:protein translocase subunit SecD [Actinotignum sp. GS-2025c]|uniref:protein translocase subunit SecD n=1 Tax=Actinotignum sp. GS-2025c TaxID=3427276 RepID=UPI003F4C328E